MGELFVTEPICISRVKTKSELVAELAHMQRRIIDLESADAKRTRGEETLRSCLRLIELMKTSSADEIIQYAIEEAERLTGSQIGYFHFVNPDQKTIQLKTWSRSTLKQCTVGEKASHSPIDQAGVWVDCIHH